MILTDTHTHLYSDAFGDDREAVIAKAMDLGVHRFFVPAIDSSHTSSMLELQRAYPQNMFLMMGLHPTSVKENYESELSHVAEMLDKMKFFAVGEIGIDLYWDRKYLEQQKKAFCFQIQLAKKYHLPIVIHCREAFDEVFEVLEMERGEDLYGIFHCFTGDRQQAERAISYNMKLGIGGVVTFKNGKIDQFLGEVDIRHIVLETDSPYLAPLPYRGKRNESAYLIQIADRLAGIYGLTREDIATITTENSKQVFGV
ncbi:MAG: TatD family hydrolase [Sediminicola sp.]